MLAGAFSMMLPSSVRAKLVSRGPEPEPVSPVEATHLRVLARVVLPDSLGWPRTDAIAGNFAKWIRGYHAGADLGYGYGFPQPREAPPSPSALYIEQLAELESAANAKGVPFAKLDRTVQQQLVGMALENAKVEVVPNRPNGRHVAADLMSYFFYIDPSGEDFLYGAAIRRNSCRGLPDSGQRPPSLTS